LRREDEDDEEDEEEEEELDLRLSKGTLTFSLWSSWSAFVNDELPMPPAATCSAHVVCFGPFFLLGDFDRQRLSIVELTVDGLRCFLGRIIGLEGLIR
jgi:hypothetical protein